jgi:hypothetical protein
MSDYVHQEICHELGGRWRWNLQAHTQGIYKPSVMADVNSEGEAKLTCSGNREFPQIQGILQCADDGGPLTYRFQVSVRSS